MEDSSDSVKAKSPQAWEAGAQDSAGRTQGLGGGGATLHAGPAGTLCPPPAWPQRQSGGPRLAGQPAPGMPG